MCTVVLCPYLNYFVYYITYLSYSVAKYHCSWPWSRETSPCAGSSWRHKRQTN